MSTADNIVRLASKCPATLRQMTKAASASIPFAKSNKTVLLHKSTNKSVAYSTCKRYLEDKNKQILVIFFLFYLNKSLLLS